MNVTIKKWGNSLALRIPRGYASDVHIVEGAPVDVSISEGKLVVDPAPAQCYSLAGLLKGVTAKNRHAEIGVGEPVGWERF